MRVYDYLAKQFQLFRMSYKHLVLISLVISILIISIYRDALILTQINVISTSFLSMIVDVSEFICQVGSMNRKKLYGAKFISGESNYCANKPIDENFISHIMTFSAYQRLIDCNYLSFMKRLTMQILPFDGRMSDIQFIITYRFK